MKRLATLTGLVWTAIAYGVVIVMLLDAWFGR